MSKVKDILGLVVRSISKRILGTSVPPMPKADGTLLFHLKRIKDGVKAAYDALEIDRRVAIERTKDINNLADTIKEASFSYAKIVTDNGEEQVGTLAELLLRDCSKVTEIYDYDTDLNKVPILWCNIKNTALPTAFNNLNKLTFAKKVVITKADGGSNQSMLPPNCAKEIILNITSLPRVDASAILRNDSKCTTLSLPFLKTTGGIYSIFVTNCSALTKLEIPEYVGGRTNKIKDCNALEEIYMPKAEKLDWYYDGITNMASLKRFIAPVCTFLGDAGYKNSAVFTNCPLLEEIVVGKLGSSFGYLINVECKNLNKIEVGEGCTIIGDLRYWTATNVADDLLNSNFKTYFAERVAARPEGSTNNVFYLLTVCQSLYDRLTEENKTILANKGWTIAISE